MSYTIEYDRQFIKSKLGITPVWLCGDNNVTTGYGGHQRRVRNWVVFMGKLAVTKEDLLAAMEDLKGGYQEHWRKGGKWVDDAGLTRWVENGCKAAASIEDIIGANYLAWIDCSILDYSDDTCKTSHEKHVTTTEEFDSWVQEVKPLITAGKIFPVISFNNGEPIKHRAAARGDDDRVVFKWKNSYLIALDAERGTVKWSGKLDKYTALTFARAEAEKLQGTVYLLRHTNIVSAKVLDNPCDVVLVVSGRGIDGHYVASISGHSFRHSSSLTAAKRYSTLASARKAAANLKDKFNDIEVGILSV